MLLRENPIWMYCPWCFRSMQQARWLLSTITGHYGLLLADYYTHFTSPIRRYVQISCPPYDSGLLKPFLRKWRVSIWASDSRDCKPSLLIRERERASCVPSRQSAVEAMKKLSSITEEHSAGEEYDAVVSSIVKFGSLLNCQTRSKVWFTLLIWILPILRTGFDSPWGEIREQPSV